MLPFLTLGAARVAGALRAIPGAAQLAGRVVLGASRDAGLAGGRAASGLAGRGAASVADGAASTRGMGSLAGSGRPSASYRTADDNLSPGSMASTTPSTASSRSHASSKRNGEEKERGAGEKPTESAKPSLMDKLKSAAVPLTMVPLGVTGIVEVSGLIRTAMNNGTLNEVTETTTGSTEKNVEVLTRAQISSAELANESISEISGNGLAGTQAMAGALQAGQSRTEQMLSNIWGRPSTHPAPSGGIVGFYQGLPTGGPADFGGGGSVANPYDPYS